MCTKCIRICLLAPLAPAEVAYFADRNHATELKKQVLSVKRLHAFGSVGTDVFLLTGNETK